MPVFSGQWKWGVVSSSYRSAVVYNKALPSYKSCQILFKEQMRFPVENITKWEGHNPQFSQYWRVELLNWKCHFNVPDIWNQAAQTNSKPNQIIIGPLAWGWVPVPFSIATTNKNIMNLHHPKIWFVFQSQQDCGKIFVPESREGMEQMDIGHLSYFSFFFCFIYFCTLAN